MKEFGDGNYTHALAKEIRNYHKHYPYKDPLTYDPLNVTDTEITEKIRGELQYILDLPEVENSIMYADEIMLRIAKGENSIRTPLSSTPHITISITERDEQGNPIGKAIDFRRLEKNCTFHLHKTADDNEMMVIGSNNLDSGYNGAIYGWVAAGMKLFRNTIEQDKCIPRITTNIEYSDTEDSLSVAHENSDRKGPMEL